MDEKIEPIVMAIRDYLKKLLQSHNTGKYSVAVEVNLSQGGRAEIYLLKNSKEKQ